MAAPIRAAASPIRSTTGTHWRHVGDVVVVTVNHRLNAFGYLYLARLDSRFPDSGNAGQLDLILALRWVRDNIAAFGGDPNSVMVFGQSGGGAKIATMMGMPAAKGSVPPRRDDERTAGDRLRARSTPRHGHGPISPSSA
jgi:carboxylesterase type B